MSSPRKAVFYKDGNVTLTTIVNLGWGECHNVARAVYYAIVDAAEHTGLEEEVFLDFDEVVVHNITYTKQELAEIWE